MHFSWHVVFGLAFLAVRSLCTLLSPTYFVVVVVISFVCLFVCTFDTVNAERIALCL